MCTEQYPAYPTNVNSCKHQARIRASTYTKATLLVFARKARSLLFLAWLRPLPLAADPDTFEPVIDDADDLRDRFRNIN